MKEGFEDKCGRVCGGCCSRAAMLLTEEEINLLMILDGEISPGIRELRRAFGRPGERTEGENSVKGTINSLERKRLIEPTAGDITTLTLTSRGRTAIKLLKEQK